jgi:regulator of protease activity HflC (stomatin/prohibitin superfamily)
VSGQEVLTADRVSLKVSLIAEFTVVDARKAVTVAESYSDALYGRLQLALREAVASRDLDVALAERGELGTQITASVVGAAQELGLDLHQVQVRDFMMAGGLREAYANVLLAKQEGLAALERARGEASALRSLANTAELMERHPGLMQLRLLQAVEAGTGNKIVVALEQDRLGSKTRSRRPGVFGDEMFTTK